MLDIFRILKTNNKTFLKINRSYLGSLCTIFVFFILFLYQMNPRNVILNCKIKIFKKAKETFYT